MRPEEKIRTSYSDPKRPQKIFWLSEERLWQLPYRQVKALHLEKRVVKPAT
jgi:hypothetical protein